MHIWGSYSLSRTDCKIGPVLDFICPQSLNQYTLELTNFAKNYFFGTKSFGHTYSV